METAIKKAIEGGYRKDDPMVADGTYFNMVGYGTVLNDPSFWQALGKVWGCKTEAVCNDCGNIRKERYNLTCHESGTCNLTSYNYTEMWRHHWHRFIDHLAEGKSPDQFFNTLLS